MSDFQTLLDGIDWGKRNPNKAELIEFIKQSLKEIKEIHDFYQKLSQGTGDEKAIIREIEENFAKIGEAYAQLFNTNEHGQNKLQELEQKIEAIKKYHVELLDGENSIKADIDESQNKITDFYDFLFGREEGQGNEQKAKEAMERITKFNERLANNENGIEVEIEEAYKGIMRKHEELFGAEEGENSKIEEMETNIEKIKKFDENLEKQVKPNIESKQKYLDDLKVDLDKKRIDVNSLLENATGGALAEGYRESMEEYSQKGPRKYTKTSEKKGWVAKAGQCFSTFIYNNVARHLGTVANHLIFFLPLVAICLIFIEPEFVKGLLRLDYDEVTFTGREFIFFKAFVSLPLLWIAWYGQKNISQRKRLFEEYNHKLRVAQMYLKFTANGNTYSLTQKKELEDTLLTAISNNPAEYLGKGETMVDSILEKFYAGGVYKKIKNEILNDINQIKIDGK